MATLTDLKREEVRQSVLRIYENFYWIHLWIIDVCARWTLKQADVELKLGLVQQAWEEHNQMYEFKNAILALGFEWDDLEHESYLFDAMKKRYATFMTTDDELEIVIGMNLFSEAVFGVSELEQLHDNSPEIFPRFPEYCQEEIRHGEEGKRRLLSILEQRPELRPHAITLIDKYRKSLRDTTSDPQFGGFLMNLVQQGLLGKDVLDRVGARFHEVFQDIVAVPPRK
jgi:hypothetical protein